MAWDEFDMQREFSDGVDTYRYIYGPGDYRIVSLEATHATVDLRDTDGTLLRQYTLTGTGSPENWSSWKHKKDFVYGPDGLLLSLTRTGTAHYSHKDHLGSLRAISDAGGVVRGEHSFYPFGQEVARTGQVDEPAVKFTGHMRDAHELSDYMLGRTCLWPLRRFASVDPGRDGWNLYAYVGNNPIKFIDPEGRLRRDANGELIFRTKGVVSAGHPGKPDRSFVVRVGHLYTDKGNPIFALSVAQENPVRDARVGFIIDKNSGDVLRVANDKTNEFCQNCHGSTFADGSFTIHNNQVEQILADDGYKLQDSADKTKVGDVLIYRKNGKIVHSATVTKVGADGKATAVSTLGRLEVKTKTVAPEEGFYDYEQIERYRQ